LNEIVPPDPITHRFLLPETDCNCNRNLMIVTSYNCTMKIALAQINPTVGDIDGNLRRIRDFTARAKARGADLVVFPELSITGYPPRDLLDLPTFIHKSRAALEELVTTVTRPAILVGYVEENPKKGKPYNAAALLSDGKIIATRFKTLLPTYDVF